MEHLAEFLLGATLVLFVNKRSSKRCIRYPFVLGTGKASNKCIDATKAASFNVAKLSM